MPLPKAASAVATAPDDLVNCALAARCLCAIGRNCDQCAVAGSSVLSITFPPESLNDTIKENAEDVALSYQGVPSR
jgi:hypothetical protein